MQCVEISSASFQNQKGEPRKTRRILFKVNHIFINFEPKYPVLVSYCSACSFKNVQFSS